MSLTSVLSDKENQELRDKFKSYFPRPEFNIKTEIKASPLTNNWGIVGTAFDYLMRFYLQHYNKNKFFESDNWVADFAYNLLINKYNKSKDQKILTGFNRDKVIKTKDFLSSLNEQYEQSKKNYFEFIESGIIKDELIANTIFLAKLDVYVRAGIIDKNITEHNLEDIKDLKNLILLVDEKKFTATNSCYFNPTFGKGSKLVGGADADLIIDNTLIDIKVTKHLKLDREHLNQVLGYYILSLIGGVNGNLTNKPIENIGIYYARHGELWIIPLIKLGSIQKFEDFKDYFISYNNKGKNTINIKEDL
jgi:hypothetical protein